MCSLLLAAAPEFVFLGAAVAVALLLIVQLRMLRHYRTLDLEIVRIKKAHHDGAVDARARVEEAMKALDALEESLGHKLETLKLETLEPRLIEADLRFDQMETKLDDVGRLVDQAREQGAGAEGVLQDARTQVEQAMDLARGIGGRVSAFEEALGDVRSQLEQVEGGLDAVRESVDRRLDRFLDDPSTQAKGAVGTKASAGGDAKPDADPKPDEKSDAAAGSARTDSPRAGTPKSGTPKTGSPKSGSLVTSAREARTAPSVTAAAAIDGVAEEEHTSPARERMKAPGPGLGFRGALIVVIALAALVFVLRWLILVG